MNNLKQTILELATTTTTTATATKANALEVLTQLKSRFNPYWKQSLQERSGSEIDNKTVKDSSYVNGD